MDLPTFKSDIDPRIEEKLVGVAVNAGNLEVVEGGYTGVKFVLAAAPDRAYEAFIYNGQVELREVAV